VVFVLLARPTSFVWTSFPIAVERRLICKEVIKKNGFLLLIICAGDRRKRAAMRNETVEELERLIKSRPIFADRLL
jgi:hypothetical protein